MLLRITTIILLLCVHIYLNSFSDPPRYIQVTGPITVVEPRYSRIDILLDANPLPSSDQYVWYKDGKPISHSYRVILGVDFIIFNPVYVGDVGSYKVVAGNFLGNDSASFQLNVQCELSIVIVFSIIR